MAGNFCTQCGNRLSGSARFCTKCGYPAAGDPAGTPGGEARPSERFGIRGPVAGIARDRSDEAKYTELSARDLSDMLACSFVHAPLETEYLLVENRQQGWRKWIPLAYLETMHGLQAVSSAAVFYVFDDGESHDIFDHIRSAVIPEVRDAYLGLDRALRLNIQVFLHFSPTGYGDLEPSVRAGWVDAYNAGSKSYTVMTVTPFPLNGLRMKKRLAVHETWLMQAYEKWEPWRDELAAILSYVRTRIQQMPDGIVRDIASIAHAKEDGQYVNVVLAKEESAKSMAPGTGPGNRILQALREIPPIE